MLLLSQVRKQHVAVGFSRVKGVKARGVLFDFGGTLLDYRKEEVFGALLEERGIRAGPERIIRAYDVVEQEWKRNLPDYQYGPPSGEEAIRRWDRKLLESLNVPGDLDELAQFVSENWDRVDKQLPRNQVRRRYPDVLPCLERVRQRGLKTGIVSNIWSEARLRSELEGLELLEYFPVLVASGSVGFTKPSREIFDIALKRILLDPGEIVFVGDDLEADYRGASNAGLNPVLIDRAGKYRELSDINRLSSLEELPRLLE
jgi:HAD superfamily hydrolase (TIGR01549 family)